MSSREPCQVLSLARVPYQEAFQLQLRLAELVRSDQAADSLLLLEHPSVITLGRRASEHDVRPSKKELANLGVELVRSSRGGLATYHGPGQLVAYVVGRLVRLGGSIPRYVQALEEVVIRSLGAVGVSARRRQPHPGVWTEQGKIASIGLAFDRGITLHGMAINLDPELRYFNLIDPCGLGELGVTSVQQVLSSPIEPKMYRELIVAHFGAVFGRKMVLSNFQ